jgi:hypothetical protein
MEGPNPFIFIFYAMFLSASPAALSLPSPPYVPRPARPAVYLPYLFAPSRILSSYPLCTTHSLSTPPKLLLRAVYPTPLHLSLPSSTHLALPSIQSSTSAPSFSLHVVLILPPFHASRMRFFCTSHHAHPLPLSPSVSLTSILFPYATSRALHPDPILSNPHLVPPPPAYSTPMNFSLPPFRYLRRRIQCEYYPPPSTFRFPFPPISHHLPVTLRLHFPHPPPMFLLLPPHLPQNQHPTKSTSSEG